MCSIAMRRELRHIIILSSSIAQMQQNHNRYYARHSGIVNVLPVHSFLRQEFLANIANGARHRASARNWKRRQCGTSLSDRHIVSFDLVFTSVPIVCGKELSL
jgi:hypothetical protein